MADSVTKNTNRELHEIEREIIDIYTRAEKNVRKRWDAYMQEADREIKAFQAQYEAAKKSGDEANIRQAGKKLAQKKKEKTLMNERYKAVVEQTCNSITDANEQALAYVNGKLPEIYRTDYNLSGQIIEAQAHKIKIDYAFNLVSPEVVRNLIMYDPQLLPFKQIDPAKDIPWNTKQINAEVLQGILAGEPMDDIAERIQKVTGSNRVAAIRSARTMVTGAENKGRLDSYVSAQDDGMIVEKEWISTDGSRTRDWHRPWNFSSITEPIDEPFHNDKGNIMYPGDPSAAPANIYNCRCSMKSVILGFGKVGEKAPPHKFEPKKVPEPPKVEQKPKKEEPKKEKQAKKRAAGIRTSYTMKELNEIKSRDKLEKIALEVAKKNAADQKITEDEAIRRFKLTVDGNTIPQLRKYINKHGKEKK